VDASGQVILKVVNASASPQRLSVDLLGALSVEKHAVVEVLAGEPEDVNTVAEPRKIYPRAADIEDAGTSFLHEFPVYSVSVFRFVVK
jgi:hypothetical protein